QQQDSFDLRTEHKYLDGELASFHRPRGRKVPRFEVALVRYRGQAAPPYGSFCILGKDRGPRKKDCARWSHMPASGMGKNLRVSVGGIPSAHGSRNASKDRFFLHVEFVRTDP
ncbi:unnamed protein product, partial [Ectocarpus sp. 12 AP-2014]